MKMTLKTIISLCGMLTFNACTMPGVVSNPNNCYPQSVTETHTKTTLVAPPSYSMPYLPPSAIYQSPPVANNQISQIQAPACPQNYTSTYYQASPVCAPSQVYQANQYQSDTCNQYPTAPNNLRYNVVGSASPAQPQYIVVQPEMIRQPVSVQLQSPICEEK